MCLVDNNTRVYYPSKILKTVALVCSHPYYSDWRVGMRRVLVIRMTSTLRRLWSIPNSGELYVRMLCTRTEQHPRTPLTETNVRHGTEVRLSANTGSYTNITVQKKRIV